MTFTFMPEPQQRGSQMDNRRFAEEHASKAGAPREAVEGREGQQHDYADLQAAGTSEPQRGIDYPADSVPDRKGDITPTLPDDDAVNWDDRVQPENHSRQVDGPTSLRNSADAYESGPGVGPAPRRPAQEQRARTDADPDLHEQPYPEGK